MIDYPSVSGLREDTTESKFGTSEAVCKSSGRAVTLYSTHESEGDLPETE